MCTLQTIFIFNNIQLLKYQKHLYSGKTLQQPPCSWIKENIVSTWPSTSGYRRMRNKLSLKKHEVKIARYCSSSFFLLLLLLFLFFTLFFFCVFQTKMKSRFLKTFTMKVSKETTIGHSILLLNNKGVKSLKTRVKERRGFYWRHLSSWQYCNSLAVKLLELSYTCFITARFKRQLTTVSKIFL